MANRKVDAEENRAVNNVQVGVDLGDLNIVVEHSAIAGLSGIKVLRYMVEALSAKASQHRDIANTSPSKERITGPRGVTLEVNDGGEYERNRSLQLENLRDELKRLIPE